MMPTLHLAALGLYGLAAAPAHPGRLRPYPLFAGPVPHRAAALLRAAAARDGGGAVYGPAGGGSRRARAAARARARGRGRRGEHRLVRAARDLECPGDRPLGPRVRLRGAVLAPVPRAQDEALRPGVPVVPAARAAR